MLWVDEVDGDGLPRRRSRLVELPATALRWGGTSRVVLVITVGDDPLPHRIKVDSRIVSMAAVRSEDRPDLPIPRPRTALDHRSAGGERRQ